ncbi:MAG TPA: DUF1800 domain-containing protein [Planctomycetota bacterium]|nr:DUF1800 domain-containing protein [Planctomycetota bacterium]
MSLSRRDFLHYTGAAALLAAWGGPLGAPKAEAAGFASRADALTYHFLNRISYGVRANDIARCSEIGIAAYLEEQLNPETIKTRARIKLSPLLKADRLKAAKGKDAHFKARVALVNGMIQRAAYSPAQLFERMVEFWSDHFNITLDELEPDLIDFQREVIRKHALGSFKDMLVAVAKHPAMLYYLDNYLNVKDKPQENYARELMELHTIGVDGGYTEKDVKEVARALTGWTVDDEQPGGFFFDAEEHDDGPKTILGLTTPGSGIDDGMAVLDYLAGLPQTAQFICRKLCVRFVSDSPPSTLVDRMAQVWMQNNGAIKPVLRELFLSGEFNASIGQKLRRPLDWYIGVVRSTGVEFKDYWYMNSILEKLGQAPYAWEPPNGYPDVMTAWANTNGLLERWNSGYALTEYPLNDRKSGIKTDLLKRLGKIQSVPDVVDKASLLVFGKTLDDEKRQQLILFITDGKPTAVWDKELQAKKLGSLMALLFASPMFQMR